MKAWIRPGPSRWNSFFCPSTTTASLRTRCGTSSNRCTGLPSRTSRVEHERAAAEERPAPPSTSDESERGDGRRHAEPPTARARLRLVSLTRRSPQLGRDRGQHLVQVADDRVVGDRHDRRLGVGVDREDPLRSLAAGDVLRRAGDAAGDVDLGRDLVARLPDLVRVRAPAGHRHRARAADRAAEQRRELLDRREALGRADAAAAGDDDLRVGERDAARRRRDAVAHPDDEVGVGELGRERLDRARRCRARRPRRRAARPSAAPARRAGAPPRAGCRPSGRGSASSGSPGVTAVQFAASGSPSRTAARAIASVAGPEPGATIAVAPILLGQRADDRRPGIRRERVERVVLGDVGDRDGHALRRLGAARPDQQRVRVAPEAGRQRERLQRDVGRGAVGVLDENEVHDATPICSRRSTTAAAASGPWPSTSACFASPAGTTSRARSSRDAGPRGRRRLERLAPGAHPPGHRRVARQVEPLEHGDHRGQRQLVDVAAAADLLLAADDAAVDDDALEPGRAGPAERVRDAQPDLEAAGVGRLVAEEDQVERARGGLVGADRLDDRARGRLGIPLLAVGDEVDARGRRRSPWRRAAAPRRRPGRA